MWRSVEEAIGDVTGEPFRAEAATPVAGGCINEAVCLNGGGRRFFVKLNHAGQVSMFEAELAGLRAICDSGTLRAPGPVCVGTSGARCYLVLEYIEFGSPGRHTSTRLGERLAAMHRVTAPAYGWDRDNTIGSTAQINTTARDWTCFFGEHRLGYQLDLAAANGAATGLIDSGNRLREYLPALFTDYRPEPSLLHGDLWGGNWATDANGEPVVFDPALYYGDREADLAMTELFGGFDDRFYQSYRHAWTLDPGYDTRKVLYNLYHILNHFNLFGGGYARQAQGMIDRLIAEVS